MTDDDRPGAGQAADSDEGAAPDSENDHGDADAETAHLADVEDGCGCAEVWEHLSERRGGR